MGAGWSVVMPRSRGCCDGDGVAEILELGEEPAGLPLGVLARLEVVLAEVLEHLAGAQQVPDQLDQRVRDGDSLSGPRQRAIWRYWAPK